MVFLAVQGSTLLPLTLALFNHNEYVQRREGLLTWMRVIVTLATAMLLPAPSCGESESGSGDTPAGGLSKRAARALLVFTFQILGFQVIHIVQLFRC